MKNREYFIKKGASNDEASDYVEMMEEFAILAFYCDTDEVTFKQIISEHKKEVERMEKSKN